MDKFSQHIQILVNTLRWNEPDLSLDFMNKINKIAKKYGYEASAFGENIEKKAILFIKDKEIK